MADKHTSEMKAIDVADYIIAKSDNVGDLITNKKLQKVLYYVKAWGLVYFKSGIIYDPFEAWAHGPVCREVYNKFKSFGYNPLQIDYNGKSSSQFISDFIREHSSDEISKNKVELIDMVFNKYSTHSSLELELLSHSEQPWLEARENLSPIDKGDRIINEDTLLRYFTSKINGKVQRV